MKLFHEFFDKHGLIRNGLYFDKLKKMINRSFGDTVCAEYYNCDKEEAKDGFKNQIKSVLDKDMPIILGIDFKKGGGHAVLAMDMKATMKVCFIYSVLTLGIIVIQRHIGIW